MKFLLSITKKVNEEADVFLGIVYIDPKKDIEREITLLSAEGSSLKIHLTFDEESDAITIKDPLGSGEAIFIIEGDDTFNPFGNSLEGLEVNIGSVPSPPSDQRGFQSVALMA